MNLYDLELRIKKTLEYCEDRGFDIYKMQEYLADGLNRYIIYSEDREELIKDIKLFYVKEECKIRYEELSEGLMMSETVKLLLKKAVVVEYKKKININ